MPTEEEYSAISERADELKAQRWTDEARDLLTQGLEKARAAGDEPFVLFFEGEMAVLDGDVPRVLDFSFSASHSSGR